MHMHSILYVNTQMYIIELLFFLVSGRDGKGKGGHIDMLRGCGIQGENGYVDSIFNTIEDYFMSAENGIIYYMYKLF